MEHNFTNSPLVQNIEQYKEKPNSEDINAIKTTDPKKPNTKVAIIIVVLSLFLAISLGLIAYFSLLR